VSIPTHALWTEHIATDEDNSDPVSAEVSPLCGPAPTPTEDAPVRFVLHFIGTFNECKRKLDWAHRKGWGAMPGGREKVAA